MRKIHDYRIRGHVNGRTITGRGAGAIDTDTGTSEMEVDFSRMADSWDPRTIVLMCCDRALVMAAREAAGAVGMYRASGGYLTIGDDLAGANRESIMHTGDGRVMAHVRASSITDFRGGEPFDHSQVDGGISHLRRGINGIHRVPAFEGIMMQAGPGLVVVTTSYRAELEDGSTVYGSTHYPHYLPCQRNQLLGYQLLRVESVSQELDGCHLHSRVQAQVLALPPAVGPTSSFTDQLTTAAS